MIVRILLLELLDELDPQLLEPQLLALQLEPESWPEWCEPPSEPPKNQAEPPPSPDAPPRPRRRRG